MFSYLPFVERIEHELNNGNSLQTGGLLFITKSIVYKKHHIPKQILLQQLYEQLGGSQLPLTNSQKKNYILITLYYLSFYDSLKGSVLRQFQIPSYNDSLEDMYMVYNLLELEERYDNNDTEILIQLNQALNAFVSRHKLLKDSLMFDYYQSLIYYRLDDFENADCTIHKLVNIFYEELNENERSTPFYHYFKLKIDILIWRIQLKINFNINPHNQSEIDIHQIIFYHLNDLYKTFYNDGDYVSSFKMAIQMARSAEKSLHLNESISILELIYKQYKQLRILGEMPYNEFNVEILFYVLFNLERIYIMKCDWKNSERILIKVNKILRLCQDEKSVDNGIKVKYSFLNILYRAIVKGEYNFKEKQSIINDYYVLLTRTSTLNGNNIINLYSINKYGTFATDFKKLLNNVKNMLTIQLIIPFYKYSECFYCLCSYVQSLTQVIIKENSITKLSQQLETVKCWTEPFIKYIKHTLTTSEKDNMINFFNSKYNQLIIINIFYVDIYYYYYCLKYNSAKNAFLYIDIFNKKINIMDNCGYGILLKLQGDIDFKLHSYIEAKDNYYKALKYFERCSHKTKLIGVTYYCIGIIEVMGSNINEAKNMFNKALNEFYELKMIWNDESIDNKINIVKSTLNMLEYDL